MLELCNCQDCKNRLPDYWHYGWDCILLIGIASIVWPLYIRRLRDYIRDLRKAYRKICHVNLGTNYTGKTKDWPTLVP